MTNDEKLKSARAVVDAVGEAIRGLGEVPSGHLYARLMGHMDLATYEKIVELLVAAGKVERKASHLLAWKGGSL